jgi:hypothetical protein
MQSRSSSCPSKYVDRTIWVVTALWGAKWRLSHITKACLSLALPCVTRPLAHFFVTASRGWVDHTQIKVSWCGC